MIWPRQYKQYLTKTIKAFTIKGGLEVESGFLTRRFERHFMTYATREANIAGLLSKDMQHAIIDFKEETGKEIYVSFIGSKIYIGVTEPKDILEPFIFSSNVSFELVREFFEDIQMLVSIVQDLDTNH